MVNNKESTKPPALLTVKEVAELLRVHQRTAYRLITDGTIRAVKIGSQWRVPEQALLDFIENGLNEPVAPSKRKPVSDQYKLPLD
ncbi:helix-turn-helix domain-containing protein [Pseudodesulfovibrio sp.]|uniref:helix-turn-helix domain-containing protein n=1 Tax=Pseudodesulfovibrio sp. TaxID=2035812 RepID=UPI00262E2C47|nr:helix-turn-helix domain-containing protein [Pseudodesulfovibrio sp.]MDD3310518.1 helix-turn-helix domain-containing protein [Pseudodesulfovibrio sp.]